LTKFNQTRVIWRYSIDEEEFSFSYQFVINCTVVRRLQRNNDKSLDEKTKLETENNTDIEETKEPIDVSQADDAQEVVAESNPWFFSSTDLTGKEIHTKEFFADSKLTLVNVWVLFADLVKPNFQI